MHKNIEINVILCFANEELLVPVNVTVISPDVAEIGVAKEIDVADYLKEFEEKKAKGVQALKAELSARMKERNLQFGKSRI